ncbi:3-phosphoshikimate 1-carboxyvinyltransferase [Hydrogenivirga sp.]
MSELRIDKRVRRVKGELRVPSDKSISHRAVILGSLAKGKTLIYNWLRSEDTLATLEIVRSLSTEIHEEGNRLSIEGRNYQFIEPADVLDARNSGTTTRLMLGVLSTQPFFSVITGDDSLRRRPMLRVVEPLREMGAGIDGRERGNKLPVCVRGGQLKGIAFFNKRASAQVKSALILAGLRAEGMTEVLEPILSRDHTEKMLRFFGAEVVSVPEERGHLIKVRGGQELRGAEVHCPADPSSAAFPCALTVLAPGGELLLRDTLVNPTRDGFYRKLREMGAKLSYENEREVSGEPIADIRVVAGNRLKGVSVSSEEVPAMIDEIPMLAVVMALAEGRSEVRGAKELRVKESDRIKAVVENLRAMGVKVEEYEDGFAIEGTDSLKGAHIKTYGDHRIAMAFVVAGLLAEGTTVIDNAGCVSVSYPDFLRDIDSVVEYL